MSDASPRIMRAIVDDLKEFGDVTDPSGLATTLVHNRLAARGVATGRPSVTRALSELEDTGVIARDVNAKRTFSVVLLKPDVDLPDLGPMPDDEVDEQKAKRPYKRRIARLDKLVTEIERLPLPERLMLVGMVADGCAAEVDETYEKLRAVLGQI